VATQQKAVATQQKTEIQLREIGETFTALQGRLDALERILQTVE
jgi:hypothetical protein